MRNLVCAALICAVVTSCKNEPTVDGSSPEKMKSSLEELKESMTAAEKEELEDAVLRLAFNGANLLEAAADVDGMQRRLRDRLDGKSASEIIAEAKKLEEDRGAREKAQLMQEISELRKQKSDAEKALEELNGFVVERSRFQFRQDTFLSNPSIELTVKNGTVFPISRAYFRGVLATPGRAVPWVDSEFNYSIPGGLEPGEVATWNLEPNMFGDWSNAPKERNDMVLTVTITGLDGPDKKSLLGSEFTEYERERLQELESQLE